MKNRAGLLLAILCLALSACGKDAGSMTVVTGLGIDGSPEDYQITAEAIQLSHDEEGKENVFLHAAGKSLSDGLDNTVSMTGRPLHCNHTQVVTVGRDLAEQGIHAILEDILTQSRYPASLQMAVCKSAASQVMEIDPVVGDIGSTELETLIQQGAKGCGNPAETVVSFYQDEMEPGLEAVLPFITLRQNGEHTVREIAGTALFRGDKMIAALDRDMSRLLLWMRGRSGGSVTVGGRSVDVKRVVCDIRAEERGAHITLRLKLSLRGNSLEDGLEQSFHREVEEELKLLISRLQELKCDAVGIGKALRCQAPKSWAQAGEDWPEAFSHYPIAVAVQEEWTEHSRTKTASGQGSRHE